MSIDMGQILTHALGFIILFVILKKFAWGALLGVLEERSRRISDEFAGIEQAKQEIAKIKADYEQHLAKIEEEARAKIQQAIAEGRRIAMEVEEDARVHSRQTLEKTKEAIALEVAKARVELKEQVVDLAIQVSHKVLRQTMDEEADRRMIESFIQEINTMDPSTGSGQGAG